MRQRQCSVLIIDDDEAIREYVRFILEKNGCKVYEAIDGNEGVAAARINPPDLIITDLVMPDKEGIETIREIKLLHPECRIIAMSGSVNSDTYLAMARHLGAHCVLRKPFLRAQLEEAVREALDIPEAGCTDTIPIADATGGRMDK